MTHDFTHRARTGSLGRRVLAATIALAVAGGAIAGIASQGFAQNDGTGASTPTSPSACQIVPASANLTQAASPVSETAATPVTDAPEGTPVSIVATPSASPVVVFGTPAASPVAEDDATAAEETDPLREELTATANALFACLNEGHFDTYAEITSDAWHGAMFGSASPIPADQFIELAQTLPEADHRLVSLDNVTVIDPDKVSAEVTYVTANQLRAGTWIFFREQIDGLDTWVLQGEAPLAVEPPAGAAAMTVTMADAGYTLDPATVSGSDVALALANPTTNDHEALVLRIEDGIDPNVLLQGGALPDGVTLVGQSTVLAGGEGTLVLTGLAPGTYTIVDLLPDENGTPNLANGMVATFTVQP